MPYLSLNTNVAVSDEEADSLLQALSAAAAEGSGKPERSVQVEVAGGKKMLMAGTTQPTAFLDVRAIGLPEAVAKKLTILLTNVVERKLGVPATRVYISFASYPGSMWGVGGATFA